MRLPSKDRARWLAQHVVPHERAIRSWLARRTHDLDIDDIIQEMYARLAALGDVEAVRNPRQYAAQTAISIALNLARHARVVPMIPLGDFEDFRLVSLEPSPERALNSQEELRDLERTLQELPGLCRTAFLMRRVEGLSQKEVADKLGISVKTVEKYMAKSVRFLLQTYGRGGGSGAQVSKEGHGEDTAAKDRAKLLK
jgi:RNA polymerase sigma factor (sigma-70 family)